MPVAKSVTSSANRARYAQTFWQTTHRGRPKGSVHSPGPRGSDPSLSAAVADGVPSRFVELPPRPRSLQDDIVSSIAFRASVDVCPMTSSSTWIQFQICRSQRCGCDQSNSMTNAVFGIVSGVSRGETKDANSLEGCERR